MGKNPAVVKPGRAASPSKPSQNCQFTLKTLHSEGVWFYPGQQIDVPVKPGVLPMKLHIPQGWKKQWEQRILPGMGLQGVKSEPLLTEIHHRFLPHSDEVWFSSFFPFLHLRIFLWDVFLWFLWLPLEFHFAEIHICRQDFVQVTPETPETPSGSPSSEGWKKFRKSCPQSSTAWGSPGFRIPQKKFWEPFKAVVPLTGLGKAAAGLHSL